MKILYLSNSIVPSKKANAVHVMRMCQSFENLGHEITLTAYKSKELISPSKFYGVSNFSIIFSQKPLPFLGQFQHAFRALKAVKKNKPDFIFGRSLISCWLISMLGWKVGFESHNPLKAWKGFRKIIFKQLCKSKNFLGLIVISKALKEIILQECDFLEEEAIFVAHDGASVIDLDKIKSEREELRGNKRSFQVGYVGTISKGRGIELILKLAEELPEMNFHFIGGTEMELNNTFQTNTSLLKNLYIYGFVSPVDAQFLRSCCDVLLAPYQLDVTVASGNITSSYMSPLKIFEYMASKKAIVTSNLPVLNEVLSGEEAILLNPKDLLLWKKTLLDLQKNPKKRELLGNAAYKKFFKYFTWDKRVSQILSFYKMK